MMINILLFFITTISCIGSAATPQDLSSQPQLQHIWSIGDQHNAYGAFVELDSPESLHIFPATAASAIVQTTAHIHNNKKRSRPRPLHKSASTHKNHKPAAQH